MGQRINSNYAFLFAFICGVIFGLGSKNTVISSIGLVGGFVSWIWISEVLKKGMYDNATPSTPVTSFDQISLIFSPIIICGIIFFMGGALGMNAAKGIDNTIKGIYPHNSFTQTVPIPSASVSPPSTPCSIAGAWKQTVEDYSYVIREDGTIDFHSSSKDFSGYWESQGGTQYRFTWSHPESGTYHVDYVTLDPDCNTFHLTNNFGVHASAVRI